MLGMKVGIVMSHKNVLLWVLGLVIIHVKIVAPIREQWEIVHVYASKTIQAIIVNQHAKMEQMETLVKTMESQ